MKNFAVFILTVVVPLVIITVVIRDASRENIRLEALRQEHAVKHVPSVDHSKHEALQVAFENPHEITAACLDCHTERGEEVIGNAHWNWEREAYIEGRGITYLGKKNLINNFCTGIVSNEGTCNRCHIGFGWKDEHFDFDNPYNIDCLICHDNSGLYEKAPGAAGYPLQDLDFTTIVQSVGQPRKHNCGYCHFHGGGGNNVKHGDMEEALLTATREVDVHMSADGADLACIDCHLTTNHQMLGRYYGVSSSNTQRAACEQCHTDFPHLNHKLNEHTLKIACQTCHIPIYAKVNPTKMFWDWSTATRRRDGKPYEIIDTLGLQLYTSEKGDFNWAWDAEPDYVWFNGTADHLLLTDIIDPESQPLKINTLFGEYRDPDARIYPVKIHRGKQPYDTEYLTIIQAKLWDEEENQGALWLDLNWEAALRSGMEHVGRPYSGHYDFVETEMYLPVNHMVSPSENALQCQDCHARSGGRLQQLEDVYIPAQSSHAAIDFYGIMLLLLSLAGVITHAGVRWIVLKRKKY